MSFFDSLEMLPVDPILGLPIAFGADPRTNKVNLGVGAYRSAEGKPVVFASVRKAETLLLERKLNKEYPPIEGNHEYLKECSRLIFGLDSPLFQNEQFYAVQCVGGASALRIGGEFLCLDELSNRKIFISNPSWPTHKLLFARSGLQTDQYSYYNGIKHNFDFSAMCAAIQRMTPGSIICLHACCHNPTGVEPTLEEWKELSKLIKKQQIIPFFDLAYQGFGEGIEEDAASIRYFVKEGHELLVAYSNSKNFGLYSERAGMLAVVAHDKEVAKKVGSNLRRLIRGNFSVPPQNGALIVATILQSAELKEEWKKELNSIRERIKKMRNGLAEGLASIGDFSFMRKQKGIFSYSGLSEHQVKQLQEKYAIYMTSDGRINVAGLNESNVSYVVDSIKKVNSQ